MTRIVGKSAFVRAVTTGSIAKTILIVLGVQALYWLLLDPWIFSPKPAESTIEISLPQLAKLESPEPSALATARFVPIELPYSGCCDDGYFAFRANFELEQIPAHGVGFGPKFDTDNFMVLVNGSLVHNPGEIRKPVQTYHGMNKRPILLPPGLLRTGNNQIDIIMSISAVPFLEIRGATLGEYKAIVRSGAARNFMIYDYRTFGGIVAGVVAMLAMIVGLRSEQRSMAIWLAVLAGTWSLRSLYHNWYEWPFGAPARVAYVFFLFNLLPLAWLNFVDSWTGHGFPRLRLALTLVFAVVMVGWTGLLLSDPLGWFAASDEWLYWWGNIIGAATILRVVWHLFTQTEERSWELALLLLCVAAVIRHWSDLGSMHLANTAPILFAAMAVAFLARNIRLFRSTNEINALLADQLKQREAELAIQYSRQEELARRETLVNERQRLMRDMHDGIGGQLMSLLFAARQKKIAQGDLVESLQSVIDELRLIIDSLDTVGGSLGTALATFRSRIEPRLNAAGIVLNWTNAVPDDLDGLGSREVLQIFRIVQEAVTNAIKHSGSTVIDIEVALAPAETSSLCIRIADHGHGLGKNNLDTKGHGIENMRARAKSIGGDVAVNSGSEGTAVLLTVPLVAARSDTA